MEHQEKTEAKTPELPSTARLNAPTASPLPPSALPILQLQQSVGNRAVQRMLDRRIEAVQAKLAVGSPGDRYEREAEAIAQQVITGSRAFKPAPTPLVQTSPDGGNSRAEFAPPSVDRALTSPATPLHPPMRHEMEKRFGQDFSAVQMHANPEGDQSARDLNAEAYTVGNHIVFAENRLAPETKKGRELIAHELTHVVQQQSGAQVQRAPSPPVAAPFDRGVLDERNARVSEAIRRRQARALAEHDRPLEPDFDPAWELREDRQRPAQLEGNPSLELSDIQSLLVESRGEDRATRIPVRFGEIARGEIYVLLRDSGICTDRPYIISLDHPALPALDASDVPALLVEVKDDVVTGEIVVTSERGSRDGSYRPLNSANVGEVLGFEDLQNLTVGNVNNYLRSGLLLLEARDMSFDLDGKFHGSGRFGVINESQWFQANAVVEAEGVDRTSVNIVRDQLGQLSVHAELKGTLKPKPDHELSGTLTADFRRGLFQIEGTLLYRSPKITGEVTVLVTDASSAWALVSARLGNKAPTRRPANEAPNGLAITGWGWVDFTLTEWLTGHAEVIVDPAGFITALGRLTPTKVIEVFPEKSKEKKFDPWEIGEHVLIYGLPGWIGGSATLKTRASVGPATLGNIVIDGYFSTYEDKAAEFSVRGMLAVPALARADLLVEAGGHVGIKGFRLGVYAKLNGSVEFRAYAAVEPHIGRTQLPDGSPSFFIRGRLEAGAGLYLGLSGGIEGVTPWPLPNISIYSFGDHSWYIGGVSIAVEGTYFLDGKQEPSFNFNIADKFNPPSLVDAIFWNQRKLSSGGERTTQFGKSFHDWVKHGEYERNVAETPKLPASEEPIKTETPTLAEHELPTYAEPEEASAIAVPTTTPTGAPPSQNVSAPTPGAPALPQPDPLGGPPSPLGPGSTGAPKAPGPGEPLPPLTVRFYMLDEPHTLYLVREGVPHIEMESTRSPLGIRVTAMRQLVNQQHQDALSTGAPVDGRSAIQLKDELDEITGIEDAANQVEADAFNRTYDITVGIPHITGFPNLAARIQAYALRFSRPDLSAALAVNIPPTTSRKRPVDVAEVNRKLDLWGVTELNKRAGIINYLDTLPEGPELERYIVSPMFDDPNTNFGEVLRQIKNPGQMSGTLAVLQEAERLHSLGFRVIFEQTGTGKRRTDPDYWDVDLATINPAPPPNLGEVFAVKRIRFFDSRDPGDNNALRENLNAARNALVNVAAKEKWVVIHVGTATAKDLTTGVTTLLTDFRKNNPGFKVRMLLSDGTEETD